MSDHFTIPVCVYPSNTGDEYQVSVLSKDHPWWGRFRVTVKHQGDGLWEVRNGPFEQLGGDGRWLSQGAGSPTLEERHRECQFDLHTALTLAGTAATSLTFQGVHVLDILKETTP